MRLHLCNLCQGLSRHRLSCVITAEHITCSPRMTYQKMEVNENLPQQNLGKVERQACNEAVSLVYVLCLK